MKHTHNRLMALFPGLPGWAGTRKVKPIWILLKQETVSGSGISWAYASRECIPGPVFSFPGIGNVQTSFPGFPGARE